MALHDGGRSPCIDENAVLDFVQGRLGEVEVARIDEHADGCLSCRQAIDEAVRAFRERSTGFDLPPDPLVTRFAAGDKLAGRYRIIRFIARGGMGEVYEAEDEMLGTHIAVKTVAAPISDNPLAARRLKQEVNLARRITHPNVCRIFDLGVHHGGPERPGPGVLFITMELIAGISLAQRLRDQGPFSPGAAVPIARAMAAAIGAAHRAGVIHRDFKCENVMLAARRRATACGSSSWTSAWRAAPRCRRMIRWKAVGWRARWRTWRPSSWMDRRWVTPRTSTRWAW